MREERYQRHSLIDWFDQERVRAMQVIVIGAGAAGNEVIKNLVLLGVGSIDIFDIDTIEENNLTRSVLFRESDVGRPKAVCAAERARELDPGVTVNAYVGDFWDALPLHRVETSAGVFCCVDNFSARLRTNRLCSLLSVDLVELGLDSRHASVSYFPFSLGDEGACYECGLPDSVYIRLSDRYSCGWLRRVAYQERKIPTTIVTASTAGAAAVSLFLHSRLTQESEASAVRLFTDTIAGTTSKTLLHKRNDCPTCGSLRPKRILLKAKGQINGLVDHISAGPHWAEVTLTTSEQIIVSYRTVNCPHNDPDLVVPVMRRASEFDETFALCPDCNMQRRQITIKDQFTVTELLQFRGFRLPAKFATICNEDVQFILELEE